jgi:LmbE family N-acetylglucosaminyl deacetylase
MTPDALCAIRHEEQLAAARIIGAQAVHFMDCADGYLVAGIDLRRDVVRVLRKYKPDVLVTCDPQTLFAIYGINHPDHRAAGQVVLDAVFPAAGNKEYFPELLTEGYAPHMPKEVWCSLTMQPNVILDITETWNIKIEALLQHKSQIGDTDKFLERMKTRRTEDSTDEDPRYEERFRVVNYR